MKVIGCWLSSHYRDSKQAPAMGKCALDLLSDCHIQVPTVMERRVAFDRVGGFDERFRPCEDYLHWIQIALNRDAVGYIDRPLAMCRRRGGGLSCSHVGMSEGLGEMYRGSCR
jgi:hypothetical protein